MNYAICIVITFAFAWVLGRGLLQDRVLDFLKKKYIEHDFGENSKILFFVREDLKRFFYKHKII